MSLRTDLIVGALRTLVPLLEPGELGAVLRSLRVHGERLAGYLDDPRFTANNHSLFHAMSLYNLAVQVPELRGADSWRSAARERVGELLDEMVGSDGVSTEQAAAYHFVALRWLAAATDVLAANGDGLARREGVIRSMTRFAALLPAPTGRLPAIGDTDFRAPVPADLFAHLDGDGLLHPEAAFIQARGRAGQRPPDLAHFAAAGYAILRPSYGESGPWQDDLHVVVDMGPQRRVHGHDDAMNVLLSAFGEELVVDSGGPYRYGVPERADFAGAAAHNTVIVDGGGYERGDVTVVQALDNAAFSAIEGWHTKWPDAEHRRTVLLVKPDVLLIVDRIRAERAHDLALLYHLPPGASLEHDGQGATVRVGAAGMGMAVVGSDPPVVTPASGWTTSAHGQREAAPVLRIEQRGAEAWFVTAIVPGRASEVAIPGLRVGEVATALAIEVAVGQRTWRVTLVPDRPPTVEAMP